MTAQLLRVGAYGVCVRDGLVLLARWVSPDGTQTHWTLPGGRVEHGEEPHEAVVREFAEETGLQVAVTRLLGTGTHTHAADWLPGRPEMHRLSVYYRVTVTGGVLRDEIGGSTDLSAWVAPADLMRQPRFVGIDTALRLADLEPPTGYVDPVVAGGLLRN